jgi:hypothetical protein
LAQVAASAIPFAVSFAPVWKAFSVASVRFRKSPSTLSFLPTTVPLLLRRSCSSLTATPFEPTCSCLCVPRVGSVGTWVFPGPTTTVSVSLIFTGGARSVSCACVIPATMPSSVTPGIFWSINFFWNALVAAVVAASNRPVIASLGDAPTALSCC